MHYVYLIQCVQDPKRHYTGQTADLRQRLGEHNAGKSIYTRNHKPWRLVWYGGFLEKQNALAFEKYLKSGSGKTFLKRHLV